MPLLSLAVFCVDKSSQAVEVFVVVSVKRELRVVGLVHPAATSTLLVLVVPVARHANDEVVDGRFSHEATGPA